MAVAAATRATLRDDGTLPRPHEVVPRTVGLDQDLCAGRHRDLTREPVGAVAL
jgi:hypothetical protein